MAKVKKDGELPEIKKRILEVSEELFSQKGFDSTSIDEIARKAGAKSLYLIHYRTGEHDPRPLVEQARGTFQGPVFLAEDFMQLDL